MNDAGESTYMSYMLRLWREDARAPWRASLQSTATEETCHFTDIDRMWAFLKAQMEDAGDDPPVKPERGSRESQERDAA